jgi:hypothetical protein
VPGNDGSCVSQLEDRSFHANSVHANSFDVGIYTSVGTAKHERFVYSNLFRYSAAVIFDRKTVRRCSYSGTKSGVWLVHIRDSVLTIMTKYAINAVVEEIEYGIVQVDVSGKHTDEECFCRACFYGIWVAHQNPQLSRN